MRVSVSAITRFHLYDLANQMLERGNLKTLYTANPWWKIDKDLRPYSASFPWIISYFYMLKKLGLSSTNPQMNWITIESYDKWVARNLSPTDAVVALAGRALYTLRKAKMLGALAVCDRGSSHVEYQNSILAEEHEVWGIPYEPIDPRGIQKELKEYEECDVITVPSKFVYRTFIENGVPEQKVKIVPYGVDLKVFYPSLKLDSVFRILYVGSVSLRKGVIYLLEALKKMELVNFELLLVGSMTPELSSRLSCYTGLYRYIGVVDRANLQYYYSQASVLVLPSLEEGLALVQAQAMACGLPVIATTNTGAENLFTDSVEGFIIPIRSSEAIREKLLELYYNPEKRQSMSEACLKQVRNLGGWDTYGRNAISVYRNALSNKFNQV